MEMERERERERRRRRRKVPTLARKGLCSRVRVHRRNQ